MATVEVTRADRDAAKPIAIRVMIGELTHDNLAEAFAEYRHRLTSTQSKDAEIAQARAEIERLQARVAELEAGLKDARHNMLSWMVDGVEVEERFALKMPCITQIDALLNKDTAS